MPGEVDDAAVGCVSRLVVVERLKDVVAVENFLDGTHGAANFTVGRYLKTSSVRGDFASRAEMTRPSLALNLGSEENGTLAVSCPGSSCSNGGEREMRDLFVSFVDTVHSSVKSKFQKQNNVWAAKKKEKQKLKLSFQGRLNSKNKKGLFLKKDSRLQISCCSTAATTATTAATTTLNNICCSDGGESNCCVAFQESPGLNKREPI